MSGTESGAMTTTPLPGNQHNSSHYDPFDLSGLLMYDDIAWVGIGIAIGSNALISVSFNVQKYAHNQNELLGDQRLPYYQLPIWMVGTLLNAIGEIGNLVSYGYAEATVITPIGAVGVVCSALLATFVLGEKFTMVHALGMTLIVAGVSLILYAKGNETVIQPTVEEALRDYFLTPQSIVYMIIILIGTAILLSIATKYGQKYAIVYTFLCSLIASWTVIGCKAFMSFIRLTVEDGNNQFNSFPSGLFPIFTLLLIVFCAVWSLHFLQQAMRYHDNNKVIPTYYATFTLMCIIGAAVVYREFEGASSSAIGLFTLGVFLAGLGVFAISHRKETDRKQGMGFDASASGQLSMRQARQRGGDGGDREKLVEMDELALEVAHGYEEEEEKGRLVVKLTKLGGNTAGQAQRVLNGGRHNAEGHHLVGREESHDAGRDAANASTAAN
mmetsp:Transcript_25108/g.59851  ORF Transcript_25108/g.59851 Transcript_25108/m.59851 type:complete len:442 (+) Transcript_25108:304-1629(+)